MTLDPYKNDLRKEKIRARESLSEEERVKLSVAICERILETPEYASAETIFMYKWLNAEVKLDRLETQAAADGKRLIYPLCISKTEMLAIEPGAGDEAWKKGFAGILEPVLEKGKVIDPSEIDLVISPCVSFDDDCRRLGMGGGFYDRYLPQCTESKIIAAAYELQKSAEIPICDYDFPVDAVVTETRLIRRNR